MEYKDYYRILGVAKSANADDVKKAYRKLAKQFHPDRNPGDKASEAKFKEINEAYDVLSDTKKRGLYDQMGSDYSSYQKQGGTPNAYNWEQWYQQSPGVNEVNMEDLEDMFGFSEFFRSFFGGATSTRTAGRRTAQPRAYEQPVPVTFKEAFQGSKRLLQIGHRRLEVTIPRGVQNGTKIKMTGQGPELSNGQRTDLYLVMNVAGEQNFERQGDDLHTETGISLYDAVLGGETLVNTPGGNVMLKIPPGTQPGQIFRLAGRGMPHLRNPRYAGDLYVRIRVQIPRQLSEQEKSLFEQLRRG